MTEEVWYGKQDFVSFDDEPFRSIKQGLAADIIKSLEDSAKSTTDLYDTFPDKPESTIRGRLSELKREKRIIKEDGKWWAL